MINASYNDSLLIQLYQEGKTQALSVLFEKYYGRIASYIRKMVKDLEVVKDIIHDTFLKASMYLKNKTYVEKGNFKAWLYKISNNVRIDYFRKCKKNESIVTLSTDEQFPYHTESSPEKILMKKETALQIKQLIKQLPLEQQEILLIRYYDNVKFRVLSEKTGISINTYTTRTRLALINLRKIIHENGIVLRT